MEGTIFQTISDFITGYIPLALQIVGAFAALATMTPNKTDDKIAQFFMDLVNFLGGNFGKAKNDA